MPRTLLFGCVELEKACIVAACIELAIFQVALIVLTIDVFGLRERIPIIEILLLVPMIAILVSLVYGIRKRKRYFLIPWLAFKGMVLPTSICVTFYLMIFVTGGYVTLLQLLAIALAGICIYIWFGVLSLYHIFYRESKELQNAPSAPPTVTLNYIYPQTQFLSKT